jgi:hypothetical protein
MVVHRDAPSGLAKALRSAPPPRRKIVTKISETSKRNTPELVLLPADPSLAPLKDGFLRLGADVAAYDVTGGSGIECRPVEQWLSELIDGDFDYVVFLTAQGVHLLTEFAAHMDRSEALSMKKK